MEEAKVAIPKPEIEAPERTVTIPYTLFVEVLEYLVDFGQSRQQRCPVCAKRVAWAGIKHADNCNLGSTIDCFREAGKHGRDE